VKTFCDYYRHPVRRVPENTPLRSMLEEFKKGDYHMALVDRQEESPEEEEARNELVGLVTLEVGQGI
jgi:metal transporter CNNM